MSPRRLEQTAPPRVRAALTRLGVAFGRDVRDERHRRGWRLVDLAGRAGISRSEVHRVENAQAVSLEACVRVGMALGFEPELNLRPPRVAGTTRLVDPVHAALGEIEATVLRGFGAGVRVDEPYQHYQFAGRADVVAWKATQRSLLHIENRTRFPDVQEFAGAWNAKRAYLPDVLAARFGISGGWLSIDHVVVALWSAEVLHVVRTRTSTFASLCADDATGFETWWRGEIPVPGVRSALVIFDPLPGRRTSRRRWVGLDQAADVRPRYRGYADAVAQLRAARAA